MYLNTTNTILHSFPFSLSLTPLLFTSQMTLSNIPGPEVSAPSQNTVIAPSNGNGGDFPIPSYSGWFSFTQIHEIERRAFPEFFSETESKDEE